MMLEDVIGSLSQKVVERDAEIALLRSRLAQREKELQEAREIMRRVSDWDRRTVDDWDRLNAFLKKAGD